MSRKENIVGFISIKELANKVGISTQAIYQRLDKDLKEYVKVIDGKKMVAVSALEDIFDIREKENKQDDSKEIANSDSIESINSLQPNKTMLQTDIQTVIQVLSRQLSEKDEQIKSLQEELNLQNEHARKQSDRLVTLIEQVNELQRNNQVLLAQKDIGNTKEIEKVKENKGFWSWMFKK